MLLGWAFPLLLRRLRVSEQGASSTKRKNPKKEKKEWEKSCPKEKRKKTEHPIPISSEGQNQKSERSLKKKESPRTHQEAGKLPEAALYLFVECPTSAPVV